MAKTFFNRLFTLKGARATFDASVKEVFRDLGFYEFANISANERDELVYKG